MRKGSNWERNRKKKTTFLTCGIKKAVDRRGTGLCPPRRPHEDQQNVSPETKAPWREVLAAAALEPQNSKMAHQRRKRRGERFLPPRRAVRI